MILQSQRIYFLGLGGIGMGGLALALKKLGHAVAGADRGPPYDPMKSALQAADISVMPRWDLEHLKSFHPDLVVMGNVCRADNPLVRWTLDQKVPFEHMAKLVAGAARLGHAQQHVVVAGTHGKTTTSFLIRHVLATGGVSTGSFIGGFLQADRERAPDRDRGGNPESNGVWLEEHQDVFVYEGDEYDCAFFDKQPKFMYYGGNVAVLMACEHDHVDLYPNFTDMLEAYGRWLEVLPPRATVWVSEPVYRSAVWSTLQTSLRADVTVLTFGQRTDLFQPTVNYGVEGDKVQIFQGRARLGSHDLNRIPHEGFMQSICVAYGVGRQLTIPTEVITQAVESFPGVRRRFQVLRNDTLTVIDDFGHHPTAVGMNLRALRQRYPQRRLCAVFEPRSATSRRNTLLSSWKIAFRLADVMLFAPIFQGSSLKDPDSLNISEICADKVDEGKRANLSDTLGDLVQKVQAEVRPGDVWVLFSNGDLSAVAGVLTAWKL